MNLQRSSLVCAGLLFIVGCSNDGNRPPLAESMSVDVQEDGIASWSLSGTDPEHDPITYRVLESPAHGHLEIDEITGAFLYAPQPDFFGTDTFSYSVSDGNATSLPALVTLLIANVDDSPTLAEIPDLHNSPETSSVVYQLQAEDVDGDHLIYEANAEDPGIAQVEVDSTSQLLAITARNYGETNIHVTVSDSRTGSARTFAFSVLAVTKRNIVPATPAQAIVITNTSEQTVEARLNHNDFPMFESDADMADFIRAMADDFPGEPFQRKLWRFVRDNAYHAVPLSADQWLYDPWVTINSLGWGFCGHVAAVYVRVARAAGYEARVWGLSGHVVPEILINDRWEMFDPDTAYYFRNHDGEIAGVEELAADPSLITSPVNSIFALDGYEYPLQGLVADFYGSTSDNFIGDDTFLAPRDSRYQSLVLPPHATLAYPGRWVDSVEGVDADETHPVPHFVQALLTTGAGWTGTLPMPWMLWDIQGTGIVEIDGVQFTIGSQALADKVQRSQAQVESVTIASASSELRFVFFLNALRYELRQDNAVALTGKDAWALSTHAADLPDVQLVPFDAAAAVRKPRASLP